MASGLGTKKRTKYLQKLCTHTFAVLDCSVTLYLRLFSTLSAALLKSLAFVNVYVHLYSWFHGNILCDYFDLSAYFQFQYVATVHTNQMKI